MSKVFEDYLSELQIDMIDICLEYVKDQGDNVYVYCSKENNMYSVGYFYKINGKMKERHKINEELPECDVSGNMQKAVMDILMKNWQEIEERCKEFNRPMPTEIRLEYDIKKNKADAQYQYENVYSKHPTKGPADIEMEWFDELSQKG